MAELLYSARFEVADAIERGRMNLLRCPVYRGGVLAAPTQATSTFSLYDPSDTAVVTAQGVTVVDQVPEYQVPALADYAYADGWSSLWSLSMPDGVQHTFRNGASLVMYAGHPVVTDLDLYRRNSALDPSGSPITTKTTYQDPIDEAWIKIRHRLRQAGRRPWLIIDESELRESHLLLTLTLIYEDLATRQSEAYRETARDYRGQFEAEWGRAKLTLQWASDSNVGDTKQKPGTGHAGFWMLGRGV